MNVTQFIHSLIEGYQYLLPSFGIHKIAINIHMQVFCMDLNFNIIWVNAKNIIAGLRGMFSFLRNY
jgi:hypothetical protein